MVAELIATLSPVEIATDDKLMFEADVPTVKPDNTTVVPSDLYSVALVTVPVATAVPAVIDRKSTRLNSSHIPLSRMPSSA